MGRFERQTIDAIIRLQHQAYGVRIHERIEKGLKRRVPLGQIYVVLSRLKDKGFVTTTIGDSTPVRGGRAKTIYHLTAKGARAWQQEQSELAALVNVSPSLRRI